MRITYYHFSSVDSTNSWAKRRKNEFGLDEFAVITSDEQTQGRGRFMRAWHSPKNNLYITFSFFDASLPPFFFSQIAALALVEVLHHEGIFAKIKWPNDLLVQDKKIAGMLTEIESVNSHRLIILGIGLNVNMTSDDLVHIPKAATSMKCETGKNHTLSSIQDLLVKKFLSFIEEAKKTGINSFQKIWHEKISWMLSKEIEVQQHEKMIRGCISSIEKDGSLLLLLDDGTKHTLLSGDLVRISQ